MRRVLGGNGQDTTAAVVAWLRANNQLWLRNLYLIGDPDSPDALWFTDHESPLLWSLWGTFYPDVIERGTVTSEIGLIVTKLEISWSPRNTQLVNDPRVDSPYRQAGLGRYDNWPVRVWTVYMPTPGDANTFGASELFGGRIASNKKRRGEIVFTVNSFLDVVNQNVPTNVIELTNTLAGYRGATPPPGFSVVPQFTVVAGGSTTLVYGDCTAPSAHQIFADDALQFGYLLFNRGGGSLGGYFSAVAHSYSTPLVVGGAAYNAFRLFTPLPWMPAAGDTFYVSAPFPLNQADGQYQGFPYVPSPESAV